MNYDGIFATPTNVDAGSSAKVVDRNVTQKVLVVMLNYADRPFHFSVGSFRELMFGQGSGTVRNYFSQASYGNFTISPAEESDSSDNGAVNDGIIRVSLNVPYPLRKDDPSTPENEADKSNYGTDELYSQALAIADASINFSDFDANRDGILWPEELGIVFIVAGYEEAYGGGP